MRASRTFLSFPVVRAHAVDLAERQRVVNPRVVVLHQGDGVLQTRHVKRENNVNHVRLRRACTSQVLTLGTVRV